MKLRLFVFVVLLAVVSFGMPVSRAAAAQRCFPETNHCIDGRIREYWEQNGGLPVFGFPIGGMEDVTIEGKPVRMQRFERNRLELHPENARPYDVLLGRLGADRLQQQGRDWFGFAKNGDTGGCQVFGETGHAVCGDILKMWKSNGLALDRNKAISTAESLALFGLPLSDLQTETLSDGKQYQVQWFERARFELHPENPAPYNVLLGLLGNEVGEFDYSLDDKPLSELTLKLLDFPSGMQMLREKNYPNTDIAKSWSNSNKAMELFTQTERLDTFASSFYKGSTPFEKIGATGLNVLVTRTRSITNAHLLLEGMFVNAYENNGEDVASAMVIIPIKNVDETKSFVVDNFSCEYLNGEKGKCTYLTVYFRNNNLIGLVEFASAAGFMDISKITEWAQKAADRMGR
jgi:hypothetical protein